MVKPDNSLELWDPPATEITLGQEGVAEEWKTGLETLSYDWPKLSQFKEHNIVFLFY